MSSVALGWFVLETADRRAKTTCAKGNLSSKPPAQHLASEAKIFSGPFQKHSVSLAMSRLEMVVYARETWLSRSKLGRTMAARITVSLLFSRFSKIATFLDHLGGFSYILSCSWTRKVSAYREHHNQKSGNWLAGWVRVMQNLGGKRNRNFIY